MSLTKTVTTNIPISLFIYIIFSLIIKKIII